jgi:hypothetical protein
MSDLDSHFGEQDFTRDLKARLQNQNEGVEIDENRL